MSLKLMKTAVFASVQNATYRRFSLSAQYAENREISLSANYAERAYIYGFVSLTLTPRFVGRGLKAAPSQNKASRGNFLFSKLK